MHPGPVRFTSRRRTRDQLAAEAGTSTGDDGAGDVPAGVGVAPGVGVWLGPDPVSLGDGDAEREGLAVREGCGEDDGVRVGDGVPAGPDGVRAGGGGAGFWAGRT